MVKRTSDTLFLDGRLRLMNNNRTIVLTFCCRDFHQLSLRSKIPATAIADRSVTEIRLKPARAKTRLFSDGRYGICLAVTKYLPKNIVTPENRYRKVRVAIDPHEFGLSTESSIEDCDGKILFEDLKNHDFELYPVRATCNNQMGDLLALKNGKLYSFHITRYNPMANRSDKRLRLRHYILGKIAFQCFNAKRKLDATCIVVVHSDLFHKKVITPNVRDFFSSMSLHVILSDFELGWQQLVSRKVLELIESTISSLG